MSSGCGDRAGEELVRSWWGVGEELVRSWLGTLTFTTPVSRYIVIKPGYNKYIEYAELKSKGIRMMWVVVAEIELWEIAGEELVRSWWGAGEELAGTLTFTHPISRYHIGKPDYNKVYRVCRTQIKRNWDDMSSGCGIYSGEKFWLGIGKPPLYN